jgi:hypothetical protein
MSGQDIWQITVIWLLSTVKFVFGAVPLALAFGFSFWKTIAVTCSGGFVGVTIFVNLGEYIVTKARKRKLRLRDPHSEDAKLLRKRTEAAIESSAGEKVRSKKKFTRTNKIIVYVKRYFGLPGIALLTPLLLSIPLGSIVAMRYYRHKNKYIVLSWMYAAIVFWSVAISSWKLFFP